MTSEFKIHPKKQNIDGGSVKFTSFTLDIAPDFHQRFADIIRAKEKEIIDECDHVRIGGLERALTTAWRSYNVLQFGYPETDTFREILIACFNSWLEQYQIDLDGRKPYIQCWANIFRENHPTLGLHGHPNGADGVTGTYYPDHGESGPGFGGETRFTTSDESEFCYTVSPQTGLINFFQCDLKHMVTAYTGKRERISIAWDIAFKNPEKNCYIPLLE